MRFSCPLRQVSRRRNGDDAEPQDKTGEVMTSTTRLNELPRELRNMAVAKRARTPPNGMSHFIVEQRNHEVEALDLAARIANVIAQLQDEFRVWWLQTGENL
jgi:hypothetical protein